MSRRTAATSEWRARKGLAWTIRTATVLVPMAIALGVMLVLAHLIPRPRTSSGRLAWYGLLLAVSWLVSRLVSRYVDRSLPLAALLEMSLSFPERAPSRLGLAQRDSSAAALARLAVSPPDESAQQAAVRILKLLTALSAHDKFTRGHAERVRAYTDLIAERLELAPVERDRLRWAALLHDIGKLRIPRELLNQAAAPTSGQWDVLRQHPLIGNLIAAPLLAWLAPMDLVIGEHHERWDGTGYPLGLSGTGISFGARIVCVADSFEAMTAARPYSRPLRRDAALRELVACAGTHFDPTVVRAFLAVPRRRLGWAMGPGAWVAGLPLVGQGPVAVLRTVAVQVIPTVASTAAVVATAVAPTWLATPAHAALPPVHALVVAPTPPVHHYRHTPGAVAHPHRVVPLGEVAPATSAYPSPHRHKHRHHLATPPPSPTPRTALAPAVRPTPAAPTSAAPKTAVVTKAAPTSAARTSAAAPIKPAPRSVQTPTSAPPTTSAASLTTAAPTTTADAVPTCSATYSTTSGRTGNGGQFSAVVAVTSSSAITGWTLSWTYPGGETVTSDDGGVVTQNGAAVSVTNLSWNGSPTDASPAQVFLAGHAPNGTGDPAVSCTAS